jgi:hypothetical protein
MFLFRSPSARQLSLGLAVLRLGVATIFIRHGALSLIRDEYEKAWLRENRPYWLHNVLARYDLATQLWIERGDRVNLARQEWYRSHRLPPAESLGIPASMPGLAAYPR